MSEPSRLVHIVDDVRPVLDDASELTLVRGRSPASSTPASPPSCRPAPRGPGGGPGRGDLRRRLPARLPRSPPTRVLRPRPLRRLRGAAPGRPGAARHRRHAVPAAARPRARHPVGGLRAGGARGRRALRRTPRGEPRLRADGRAAHAPDRDHAARQPARAGHRAEPVERRAAGARPAPRRCWRSGSASGAIRRMGYVAHIPHYLAQMEYPQAAVVLLEQLEIGGRLTIDLDRGARRGGRSPRPRSPTTSSRTTTWARSCTASSSSTTPSASAESAGSSLLAADEPMPTGEEIGRQFEQFLAGLDPQTTTGRRADAGLGRRARRAAGAGGPRRRPVPRSAGATARQRVFGGQVAAQAVVAATRSVEDGMEMHSHALLLPAPRRHGRADHLRRRADPGRSLVRDPAGDGAPARAPDLLHDRQLPGARGRPRPPGPDAGRAAARAGRLDDRPRAAEQPRVRRGVAAGVGRARRPLPRHERHGTARRPRPPGARPAVGPGRRRRSATTRSCTWLRSPTPPT